MVVILGATANIVDVVVGTATAEALPTGPADLLKWNTIALDSRIANPRSSYLVLQATATVLLRFAKVVPVKLCVLQMRR